MNLLDVLKPECIKVPLVGTDKASVLSEMVDLIAIVHGISDATALKEAVLKREQTRTTGIGHGLAIPHGKSESCPGLFLGVGRPAQPIDFQSIDRKPVRLVIMVVSAPDRTNEHIQALAHISRLMANEPFRESIYNAATAEEIYRLFARHEIPAGRV